MVHYSIVGRVDSQEVTVCERLLDILAMSMPDFTIEKEFCLPAAWRGRLDEIVQTFGYSLPGLKPLIVSSNGRLVATSADDFTRFVLVQYGVRVDLTAEQVANYTVANHDLLLANAPPVDQ
ncbi:hypothetical protein SPRG_20299 [Saprolegnia parasitica CBS 223.65]|uniref:Uncharacterized protein n=1 Tax=Saprolegnia parasitica (strain CBS 223.65) TaxID=695850 RepID=A0A067CCC3_SAPPC|nr:hypothetical protein SPRG_20299 [Saprolegnia parasitica CBS 223.65]KDO28138.1 hypothetical protein SPRG_20299 [Saprolegnia parasitica CBS 223.65]|eukprot:XP_012201276.1 hypothetical protein SPRG_20299 [Saprolegnia parasitica CBS 223.65]